MVNNLIFIEDGSLNEGNLDKLRKAGITDDNFVVYRQGSTKPELVSVNNNDDVQDIVNEIEQQIKNNIFETLEKYLDNVSDKKSNDGYNLETCKLETYHVFTVYDSVQDFVAKFKKFVEDKCNE